MKEVILKEQNETRIVLYEGEDCHDPIFAIKAGWVLGMIVFEHPNGWILRLGCESGANGHHNSTEECIRSCTKYGYKFVTDLKVSDIA